MCGVPLSRRRWLPRPRLIRARVSKSAICEQMGAGPALEKNSSGPRSHPRHHPRHRHRPSPFIDARAKIISLAAVAQNSSASTIGLALVDLSTGEFQGHRYSPARTAGRKLSAMNCNSFVPRETHSPSAHNNIFETSENFSSRRAGRRRRIPRSRTGSSIPTTLSASSANNSASPNSPGFGLDDHPQALSAARRRRPLSPRKFRPAVTTPPSIEALRHLDRNPLLRAARRALSYDPVSVRNLELVSPISHRRILNPPVPPL